MDKTELKVGSILWNMNGREQNGVVKFYARPHCIEHIDEHKFLFGDGCGGSINSIGRNYFLTRQEAIDHYLEKHNNLEIKLPEVEDMEECIHHEERTDFQDLEVVRFDSVNCTSVYLGGFEHLDRVTDKLNWHTEFVEGLDMDVSTLTLTEIYEQLKRMSSRIITVFVDSPLEGVIYQCGNYEEGKWVKIGTTKGYA